ncbi:hypothetical protein Tco_0158329 [Tanacetum coccineum]
MPKTFSKQVSPHIESKVKWLKTKFHIIDDMLKQSGFQWNEMWRKRLSVKEIRETITVRIEQLVESLKDLETRFATWNFSKMLKVEARILMSVKDKTGLGFSGQLKENELYNEALMSVFDRNYMPLGPDREIDESKFTYDPKQSKTSESDAKTSDFDSCKSNSSVETLESVPEPVVIKPNVVSQNKFWFDAHIIEEYESNSDDKYVFKPLKEQEKPSFAFSPKVEKRDWNGLMSKNLGLRYGFTRKNGKGTDQGENRPVWNNVQRLNHQNKFVPTTVLTRTGRFPVNTARHNFNNQAVATSVAWKVNVVRPIMNDDDPHKALKNKGIVDSGCSRHMTRNKAYLVEYQDYNGGPVAFGGSKCYITGKGKIRARKLDFEDVCFVKELQHFNLFSVSQMCDKKNKVLFTDTEYLVLSPDFKLPDENQVLLRVPDKTIYTVST